MKFSRLSTIQFTENDFQNKSPLDIPIVPRGEALTFMELEEGFNITLLTAIPSIPASIDIVNVRTGKRTAISNTTSAPCVFSGIVPKSLRPGIYRAEFLVRNTKPAVSAPFRVIADNEWGAIVGNNYAERYTDGTPSIVGGQLVKFVQYFRRRDFRLSAVENNTFYDDERGTSFSLQDKNYARHHLEGYAGERTIAAISMLLAGSVSADLLRQRRHQQHFPAAKIGGPFHGGGRARLLPVFGRLQREKADPARGLMGGGLRRVGRELCIPQEPHRTPLWAAAK